MRTTVLVLMVATLVSACSTQQVHFQPDASLKTVSSVVELTVQGQSVDPSVIEALTRYLKAKLIIAGFDLASGTSSDSIRLNVDVHSFDPGNAAARLTVGFGAGRGSLLYNARYRDPDGRVLAEIEGQERFTDGEVGFNMEYGQMATLGGAETVQTVLVQEAAKHIVELASGSSGSR